MPARPATRPASDLACEAAPKADEAVGAAAAALAPCALEPLAAEEGDAPDAANDRVAPLVAAAAEVVAGDAPASSLYSKEDVYCVHWEEAGTDG